MPRPILGETSIHPAIRQTVAQLHGELIQQVQAAMRSHPVLVVGMSGNPFVGRACKALARSGVPFKYIGYGTYVSGWRRRNALKMWTGWPTFPMVFVGGVLVGGAADLERLLASGELKATLP